LVKIIGIHAREWIAPAMATYIMNELIEKNATNYIDYLNFHILPSANPGASLIKHWFLSY
jgi:hypothetical protein